MDLSTIFTIASVLGTGIANLLFIAWKASDLNTQVQNLAARLARIVVLDAARANPFARTDQPLAGGLALVQPDPGSLIAFNAAPGTIAPEGKDYKLQANPAVLFVRPRGWHLVEKNHPIDGQSMSASLFDFGLYFFHNCEILLDRGSSPYFYLPKMESHLEAKLWNDVFLFAQWVETRRQRGDVILFGTRDESVARALTPMVWSLRSGRLSAFRAEPVARVAEPVA